MKKAIMAVVASNLACGALTSTDAIPVAFEQKSPEAVHTASDDLAVQFEQEIPESFFEALADVHNGRTTDLDIALTERPPET